MDARKRAKVLGALAAVFVLGSGTAFAVVSNSDTTASCTPAPVVEDNGDVQSITITCDVPKLPAETVTATATETATVTATETATVEVPGPTTTATVTETATVPGPTTTVTVPGPTSTVTRTVTASPSASQAPTQTPTSTPPTTSTPTPTQTPTSQPPTGFPNASNTGTPAGTVLTAYTGPMTINSGSVTIRAKAITGQLVVNAGATVTIDDSALNTSAYYGILNYGTVIVEDTTLKGALSATIATYENGSFTGRRIDVSGGEDGVRLGNNSTLVDSYVHDLANQDGGSDPHYDAVTADGYRGWRIEHNTILNKYNQTACVWVGDPRYAPSEGVLTRNYLAGGGYCIYAGPGTGAGIRVTDNVFGRDYWPKGGYWGPVAKWTSAGNTWTGNTWTDGTPVNP